ncbi:hypothetical protein GCM10023220_35450 [Streptomyces ziwulingensis]|uniref:Transposase IS116/IS110/IS902 C-terminal domain-containing protein n=1 Tax=Streptomyces ziwulingensis TaxID=1045501 RepID=A0ABP9C0H3_9ACTN
MPGMGPILGADFVAIVGDLSSYRDADRLASYAGLAPVVRDSGRRTGDYQRPKRYDRRLRHLFHMAAQNAMMRPGPSRDYCLRKRGEGLLHTQALLAFARRRIDVLWAVPRDKRLFTPASRPPPSRGRLDFVIEVPFRRCGTGAVVRPDRRERGGITRR